jgi:hypothetical protein
MDYKANNNKVYVPVVVSFTEDGEMRPRSVIWEDGHIFTIDRVLDIRPSAAQKAGGQGDKYTVKINGKVSAIYFERTAALSGASVGRWFVERA